LSKVYGKGEQRLSVAELATESTEFIGLLVYRVDTENGKKENGERRPEFVKRER